MSDLSSSNVLLPSQPYLSSIYYGLRIPLHFISTGKYFYYNNTKKRIEIDLEQSDKGHQDKIVDAYTGKFINIYNLDL